MHQTFAIHVVSRPKTTPINELERYMRCRDRSQVRGYACKRSHMVALRQRKISASDPPSTWWPGEKMGLGQLFRGGKFVCLTLYGHQG
jgi:hypothetical protein